MKKILRWLVSASGMEEELRNKHYRELGDRINDCHFWFNGGSVGSPKYDVLNALYFISKSLKENAWFDSNAVREKVYKLNGRAYHRVPKEELDSL